MIKNINIKNFKSIKLLELDCRRINLFIGKPNTGKSNILEGIGIFTLVTFPSKETLSLLPPFGENLLSILLTNKPDYLKNLHLTNEEYNIKLFEDASRRIRLLMLCPRLEVRKITEHAK